MSAIASIPPSGAALKLPGFWQRARHHRSFVIGGVLAALLLLAALVSYLWTPYSPYAMDMAASSMTQLRTTMRSRLLMAWKIRRPRPGR